MPDIEHLRNITIEELSQIESAAYLDYARSFWINGKPFACMDGEGNIGNLYEDGRFVITHTPKRGDEAFQFLRAAHSSPSI